MTDPELARVVDRMAVSDVLTSYAAGVDRRDWSLIESCFASDAYVEGTRKQASFVEYFPFLRAELVKFERTVHFLGNHRASIDGDRARAETYAVALHFWTDPQGQPCRMAMGVRYDDELRRASGWRITLRRVAVDWLAEGAIDLQWTMPLGERA